MYVVCVSTYVQLHMRSIRVCKATYVYVNMRCVRYIYTCTHAMYTYICICLSTCIYEMNKCIHVSVRIDENINIMCNTIF